MLSIAKISAAKSAALTDYFERTAGSENYYENGGEPPGQWAGKGAERLGLEGQIKDGELGKAMQGFHPEKDYALVKNAGEESRAPAWDCTFSAPKSVSAEWACAPRAIQIEIQSAHDAAIATGIDYLEREACFCRRGHAGEIREQTAGLIAALYSHSTSRNGDPQLHTHVLVMNAAERQDGSWGGIDLDTHHKMAAGALYRAELAENLRQKGFQIQRDGDSFKVVGVPDKLVDKWSSRNNEIQAMKAEKGLTGYVSAKKVSLETRSAKGEINRAESFGQWKEEAAIHGFSEKEAAALKGMEPGKLLEQPNPEKILAGLSDKQSTFSKVQILHQVAKEAQGTGMGSRAAEAYVSKVLSSMDVVRLKKGAEVRFTTKEMLQLEQRMAEKALDMTDDRRHQVDARILDMVAQGQGLSAEQQKAVEHITKDTEGIACVQGWAGTGKSYMLDCARQVWAESGLTVKGAALSGKAAEGLEKSAGIQSQTIHSLLKDIAEEKTKLGSRTVLVVDEAGMVGSRQMERLVSECGKSGAKLVLVGDSKQLQPIEAGGAFKAFSERIGSIEMADVRRQQKVADREMAKAFREGRSADALMNLNGRGLLHVEKNMDKAMEAAVKGFMRDATTGKSTVMLAATHGEVYQLNQMARAEAKQAGMVKGEDVPIVTAKGERHFCDGDRLVFTRNSRELEVKNGTMGTVRSVDEKQITVTLAEKEITIDHKHGYCHFDHAYALTAHKAQGVTVERAHVLAGEITGKEWAYVAASRAAEQTHLYTCRDLAEVKEIERSALARDMARSQEKETTLDYQQFSQPEAQHGQQRDYGLER